MSIMNSVFFTQNRQELFNMMPNSSVLILFSNDIFPKNGDQYMPFRQQSDLYYLTGIDQEKTSLILHKDSTGKSTEILSIMKPEIQIELWEGKKLNKESGQEISGIKQVIFNEEKNNIIADLIASSEKIYLLQDQEAYAVKNHLSSYRDRVYNTILKTYPNKIIDSPRAYLNTLRLVKKEAELEAMKKATELTRIAYMSILSKIKTFKSEYEVEAELNYQLGRLGIKNVAYDSIIATGINACHLHYNKNNALFNPSDMLLMDFGADYKYYAADLSRTIPVNGKFNLKQKKLYNIVLEVQKKTIPHYIPGNTIDFINQKSREYMTELLLRNNIINTEEAVKELFPHGTAHFLGIDVHDVGSKQTILKKGMVLTCEPGIYVWEEAIGIRIEDDIVVDDTPYNLMQDFPKEIEEIEAYSNH